VIVSFHTSRARLARRLERLRLVIRLCDR